MTAHSKTSFHIFAGLPTELRARIWQLAFTSHIIRWVRVDDEASAQSNRFPYSRRPNIIHHVCREARKSIFLHAKFVALDGEGKQVYSPSHDHLHLDASWRGLPLPQLLKDPLASLPFDYQLIRRIMINPNYTDQRMKPGLAFEKLPALREILIVADEKSVGLKDKFMLASVYDLQKYFEGAKRRNPKIKMPYIAVGCLGWVGENRFMMSHSTEDGRQLVAVFESQGEMKDHLSKVREEETRFLKSTFRQRTGFKLKFKPGFSMEHAHSSFSSKPKMQDENYVDEERSDLANKRNGATLPGVEALPLCRPPTYAEIAARGI